MRVNPRVKSNDTKGQEEEEKVEEEEEEEEEKKKKKKKKNEHPGCSSPTIYSKWYCTCESAFAH